MQNSIKPFSLQEAGIISPSLAKKGENSFRFSLSNHPEISSPAPLETLTKSVSHSLSVIDPQTGTIQEFVRSDRCAEFLPFADSEASRKNARWARYKLQREARKILSRYPRKRKKRAPRMDLFETTEHLLAKDALLSEHQEWRVTGCGRRRIDSEVKVFYSQKNKRAHYGNLMVCGSAWTCPVCAAKIAEKRRQEISSACDQHVASGGGLGMVTLTFRHDRFDDLQEMIVKLRAALKKFRSSKKYKSLLVAFGYGGLVRALEVTHSFSNGWHPHLHELWFFDKPLSARQQNALQRALFDLWLIACEKVGLGLPTREHGLKVTATLSPAEYLSKLGRDQKWGVGSELTQLARKEGKNGSRTPFDLLRDSAEGDKPAGTLFAEFAFAFLGARQLFWSHGLKALFGLDDLSDEEVAELEEEDAEEIYIIDSVSWSKIVNYPQEIRGTILDLAESGGHQAIHEFILRL